MSDEFDPVYLVAKQLHEDFRAACKSMGITGPNAHDHGFNDCGARKSIYFVKRARLLCKRSHCTKPETLGEAEQTLQAKVFWNTRA
jgi:hypothetical protein